MGLAARVPSVAAAPLSDTDPAQLLNCILRQFEPAPLCFKAYSAQEIGALRGQPLRTEAARERARLIAKLNQLPK